MSLSDRGERRRRRGKRQQPLVPASKPKSSQTSATAADEQPLLLRRRHPSIGGDRDADRLPNITECSFTFLSFPILRTPYSAQVRGGNKGPDHQSLPVTTPSLPSFHRRWRRKWKEAATAGQRNQSPVDRPTDLSVESRCLRMEKV